MNLPSVTHLVFVLYHLYVINSIFHNANCRYGIRVFLLRQFFSLAFLLIVPDSLSLFLLNISQSMNSVKVNQRTYNNEIIRPWLFHCSYLSSLPFKSFIKCFISADSCLFIKIPNPRFIMIPILNEILLLFF